MTSFFFSSQSTWTWPHADCFHMHTLCKWTCIKSYCMNLFRWTAYCSFLCTTHPKYTYIHTHTTYTYTGHVETVIHVAISIELSKNDGACSHFSLTECVLCLQMHSWCIQLNSSWGWYGFIHRRMLNSDIHLYELILNGLQKITQIVQACYKEGPVYSSHIHKWGWDLMSIFSIAMKHPWAWWRAE